MEALKQAYKILFSIELQLPGYSGDLNQFIRLVPDQPTTELFAFHKTITRYQKDTNVVLVQVEAEGGAKDELRTGLEANETFRLQLKLSDSGFINATHLAFYDLYSDIIFLTNEVSHISGTDLLLSAPLQNYNPADAYKKGYLVQSGGSFYQAIKASSGGDVHGVGETAYWISIPGAGNCVSQADLKSRASLSSPVDSDTLMLIEISHSVAVSAAYSLIDGTFKCREVAYKIKLLNGN